MKKVLIIRLSSIGDIVLTSPVIRCLKLQFPEVEIHFLTKRAYSCVLESNPYIHTVHCMDTELKKTIIELQKEEFDWIIDLHKNIRSFRIILGLGVKHSSFSKLNLKKWWYVQTKRNCLPNIHIVDRYFQAVVPFQITNDQMGLDYFLQLEDQVNEGLPSEAFTVIVCGGAHATKQMPPEKIDFLCEHISSPVFLLGGKEDAGAVAFLEKKYPEKVVNGCGKFSLNQSASILQQARCIITADTGLMHIASAFQKEILSVWGNTVPAFGMSAYMPQHPERVSTFEVNGLSCRPCSKIGFDACPKKHFRCMNDMNWTAIYKKANQLLSYST